MLRAIYRNDLRFDDVPVFQFNKDTGRFHLIGDQSLYYDFEKVMEDPDFILYVTDGKEHTYFVSPENRNTDA